MQNLIAGVLCAVAVSLPGCAMSEDSAPGQLGVSLREDHPGQAVARLRQG